MSEKENKLIDIVKDNISKNLQKKVTLDSKLRDELGFDSIKLLTLSIQLEEQLGFDTIRASEEVDFTQIITLNDVLKILHIYCV